FGWLFLVLFVFTATGHIQEFGCFSDFAKELVCDWKVPAQTNCSKEFLLYYREEIFSPQNVCVPENGKESFTCTCTIYPDYFVSGLTYVLALQFNGTDMWNYSVTPALVGKTLFNLSPGHLVSGFAILADSSLMTPEWFFLIRC
uniref:Interleukin-4 receptor alpha N-terminal domain-containing protein n=1 Tax=Anser brachyrhynchus TaxID=132585 RepID=A0A8B9ICK6_9AVES